MTLHKLTVLSAVFPSSAAVRSLAKSVGLDQFFVDRDFPKYFPMKDSERRLGFEGCCTALTRFYSSLGAELRLYRAYHKVQKLNLDKPLGHHWSTARIDNSDPNALVACGLVPRSSVNWLATFFANFVNPNEREVVVTGPIKLAGMIRNGKVTWTNPDPNRRFVTLDPRIGKDAKNLVGTI